MPEMRILTADNKNFKSKDAKAQRRRLSLLIFKSLRSIFLFFVIKTYSTSLRLCVFAFNFLFYKEEHYA